MNGDEGYRSVVSRYGRDVAEILLVAHLRRVHGAMESYPPPERATTETDAFLVRMGLIED